MRIGLFILSLVMLTGCAAQPNSRLASGARQCVSSAAISGRYALRPNSIMFEMTGPVDYRNTLATECRSLERLGSSAAMVFENSTPGQICSGDRVRLFDARGTGPDQLSGAAVCVLGPFMAVLRS